MSEEKFNAAPDLKNERMAHIVRELSKQYFNSLERRLLPYGVNHGFWAYLRELWNEDGISQKALSERVGLTGPTTNSVVKRMLSAGLIELRPIVEGKPRQVVYLTEYGKSLRETLEPLAKEVNDVAQDGIGTEEIAIVRKYLLNMYFNLLKDNN
ncbi:MarR family transcriptional regulator [Marinobacterium iners]|jgi:DNA-binding MarR family transcriptional regulator|uniref:MarR family winged helix-turn-helix transcriptional regulator n=1 Tax=Pseudomonadota TaxID=1224 RepID=UPI001A8D89AD|nr:MarR family winged helix-turn-helix transcriptional regulator [Marinobacterium iners]QSR36264.1 MarR family transcriptional regulator [Marinobacterium iners]